MSSPPTQQKCPKEHQDENEPSPLRTSKSWTFDHSSIKLSNSTGTTSLSTPFSDSLKSDSATAFSVDSTSNTKRASLPDTWLVQLKEEHAEDPSRTDGTYFSFPDFDTYGLLNTPKPSLSQSEGSVNALRSCERKPSQMVRQGQSTSNSQQALQTSVEETTVGPSSDTSRASSTTLSNVWKAISSALTLQPQDPLLLIDDRHPEAQAIFQFYVDIHIYRARKKNESRAEEHIKKSLRIQWEEMGEDSRRKWAERYCLFEHDERLEEDEEALQQTFGRQRKRRGSSMEETDEEWDLQDMDWKAIWKGRARTNVYSFFKENL